MICKVCSAKVKNDYVFCPNCGNLLLWNTNEGNENINENINQNNSQINSNQINLSQDKKVIISKVNEISEKRSFFTRFFILLSITGVIFLISFLCFSFMMLSGYGSGGIGGIISLFLASGMSLIFSTIMLIIIRQMDFYEKEPWSLVIFSFLWGALGATLFSLFANQINSFIFTTLFGERIGSVLTGIISAPIFEEFFKLLVIPILIIFFRTHFNSPMDGMVYIFSSSLGFKIVEDLVYGAKFTSQAGAIEGFLLLALIRWLLGFLGHPLMSMYSGFAVGLATITPNYFLKILYITAGYILSVGSHFLWNFNASVTVQILREWTCLLFPLHTLFSLLIFVILYFISINIDRKILRENLKEELNEGLLDNQLIDELTNLSLRSRRKSLLKNDQRKIYDIFMSELASYAMLKKQSINSIGKEITNTLYEKREVLKHLKPYIYT
ncbi:MAG: PrsW family intramembrane metalloprotease [bacterium]